MNDCKPLDVGADDGCTPLYAAALAGHVDVVKVLLTHGADVPKVYAKASVGDMLGGGPAVLSTSIYLLLYRLAGLPVQQQALLFEYLVDTRKVGRCRLQCQTHLESTWN